jgi:hypothetical protein
MERFSSSRKKVSKIFYQKALLLIKEAIIGAVFAPTAAGQHQGPP